MSGYNQALGPAMGRSEQNLPGHGQRVEPLDQVFSPSRWWKLVSLHWAENRRRYLLAMLAIAGALFAWYSFVLIMDRYEPIGMKYQITAYYIGLLLIGCLYGSMLFSDLGHKTRSIQYLSIPASQLEKLLCALFFGVLLFFIAYTLLFYLVDIPMVGLANKVVLLNGRHILNAPPADYPIPVYNLFSLAEMPMPESNSNIFLLGYFALQAAFILGSVYFVRYSFLKTVVGLLVFWLICMLFVIKGLVVLIPDGWHLGGGLFEWSHFDAVTSEQKLVRGPSWVSDTALFIIKYCFPLIFWSITYIRLKEKEV